MARPPCIVTTQMPAVGDGIDRDRVRAICSAIRKLRLEIENTIDRESMVAESIAAAVGVVKTEGIDVSRLFEILQGGEIDG